MKPIQIAVTLCFMLRLQPFTHAEDSKLVSASDEREIRSFYDKLNFVSLFSTEEERDRIERRKGDTAMFESDTRLGLVEKYLDEISNIPIDSRSTAIGQNRRSRWKNPSLRHFMTSLFRIESVQRSKESYFVKIVSIDLYYFPYKKTLAQYAEEPPKISEVDSILAKFGNWSGALSISADEWKKNGGNWQFWKIGSGLILGKNDYRFSENLEKRITKSKSE